MLAFTLAGGGPIGVVGGVLLGGGVVVTLAFLGWFAALVLGRMPLGLRDLSGYSLGYGAQANAYFLLLTDRYPNSDPDAIGPEWSLTSHQLQLELSDDGRRSRLTVFFRLLLALPHFVWLALWTVVGVPGRDRERDRRARARPFRRAAAPLSRRLRALLGPCDRVHHAGRKSVPGLRRRTRVPGRHHDRPARPPEPLGHALPKLPRDSRAVRLRAPSPASSPGRLSSAGSSRS